MAKAYFYDKENKELIVVDGQNVRALPQILPADFAIGPVEKDNNKMLCRSGSAKEPKERKRKGEGVTQKEVIIRKYQDGMIKAHDLAKATGSSVGSVYSIISKAKKNGELVSKAEEKPMVGDFGLGKEVIKMIIEAKKTSEMSDEQIAQEYEITVSQLRALYTKHRND